MIKAHVGDTVSVTLGWSEVNVHMGVAGKTMSVRVLADGAQLLDADGSNYSFPITHGEAGIKVVPRETVWCEAHGGLANPHFDGPDCVHPHYTDSAIRARLNAEIEVVR